MTEQKTRKFLLSTPETEELGERCGRFRELLKKTLVDFLNNDGPLPLDFLQEVWPGAIRTLLVTGNEVLPRIVERPER